MAVAQGSRRLRSRRLRRRLRLKRLPLLRLRPWCVSDGKLRNTYLPCSISTCIPSSQVYDWASNPSFRALLSSPRLIGGRFCRTTGCSRPSRQAHLRPTILSPTSTIRAALRGRGSSCTWHLHHLTFWPLSFEQCAWGDCWVEGSTFWQND